MRDVSQTPATWGAVPPLLVADHFKKAIDFERHRSYSQVFLEQAGEKESDPACRGG